jgi:WD40 repeat protein/tRNA A-37 threonylcarbamoyl transferase component Bud32
MNQLDPEETIAQPRAQKSDRSDVEPADRDARAQARTLGDFGARPSGSGPSSLQATLPLDDVSVSAAATATALRVPGYEILGELGRGGMGVVYKARQVGLNRLVAIKMVLAGAHAGSEAIARFGREAEAVAAIQHPNIVQIYDIGEQDGMPYFSLEYVDGGNLGSLLTGAPVPSRRAAAIVETLALAVQVAHDRGIVHRDLKPINVLMTRDGVPKIADFGLAKRLDSDQGQTETGSILGSPSYMAPEQAEGQSKNVGPAADIYALGAILYELIAGRPPFRAETAIRTMQQVIAVEPVPPARLQPGLDRDLETICLTCLQKDPAKRYRTAEAMAEDLRRYQVGEPILARPVSAPERVWRWCRRNPLQAALGASVLLLLVTVAIGSTAAAVMLGIAREKTGRALEQARVEAIRANKNALAAAREQDRAEQKANALEKELYRNGIALAEREWRDNHVVRALRLLADCPEALRQWEWHYLNHLCHGDLRTIRGPRGSMQCMAVAPGGDRAATGGLDGLIRIWNLQTGEETATLSGHTWSVTSLAFSPSGDRLVSGSLDGTVRIWDIRNATPIRVLEGHQAPVHAVAWSESGDKIASAAGDDLREVDELKVWDATTGRARRSFRSRSGMVTALAFGPDGTLASAGTDGSVRIWEIDTGTQKHAVTGQDGPVNALAFDSKGSTVFSAGENGTIRLWDPASGRERAHLVGHAGAIRALVVGLGGKLVASAGVDGTVRLWEADELGWHPRTYRGHAALLSGVGFARDARVLASCDEDGFLKLWNAQEDPEAATLAGATGAISAVDFDRNGRFLAVGGADHKVRILEARTRRERFKLEGHSAPVLSVAFNPNGSLLASASADATIKLWDISDGSLVRTLTGHRNDVRALSWSPDGKRLASGSTDTTIILWDSESGRAVHTLRGHTREVTGLAFRDDGRRIASSSRDHTVNIWNCADGTLERTLEREGVGALLDVAYRPGGEQVAAAGKNGVIMLWDPQSGASQGTLEGHTASVWKLAYNPGGERLFSAAGDRTVRLWEVAAGREILVLHGRASEFRSLALSPQGRQLAAGTLDGATILWDASPSEAESVATPNP